MDSFVCKIVILRSEEKKVLKPKNFENNLVKPAKVSGIKRCLFGVSKLEDTEKMLQEQYEIDRKRFNERFGIDLRKIEENENLGNCENVNSNSHVNSSTTSAKKNSIVSRKILKRSREVFRQQNSQTILTDFYKSRKTVQSLEISKKDTKEN